MRNFSKNKFLLCFRPVVDIDAMLDSKVSAHRSASCHSSCIPVSNKLQMINSSENKTAFFNIDSSKFSESWIMDRSSPKRTLSRAIKAVVFETILKKRVRHKNSFRSKRSYSSSSSSYTETEAPQSPLSTSSSNDSTSSCSSIPQETESKNLYNYHSMKGKKKEFINQRERSVKRLEWFGIYLVLISLAFTVFWGKIFGIILTLMCLCFFSVWNSCQKKLPSCARNNKKSLQCKDRDSLVYLLS